MITATVAVALVVAQVAVAEPQPFEPHPVEPHPVESIGARPPVHPELFAPLPEPAATGPVVSAESVFPLVPLPRGDGDGCRVAFVLGGAAGMLVGALAGYGLERALDGAEDAGVTGLTVGSIAGFIAGSRLASRGCQAAADRAVPG